MDPPRGRIHHYEVTITAVFYISNLTEFLHLVNIAYMFPVCIYFRYYFSNNSIAEYIRHNFGIPMFLSSVVEKCRSSLLQLG